MIRTPSDTFLFFFNDTATTEIYTLSLHDALPISSLREQYKGVRQYGINAIRFLPDWALLTFVVECMATDYGRSEEHTSELQSQSNLVCRLLLEKKKTNDNVCYCESNDKT